MLLARILKREGCELIVADVDQRRATAAAKELGARAVVPEEILHAECDVLAPCALGGAISPENVGGIRAKIVCGSANNILSGPEAGDALAARGIIYAPDYLVNAGGLIRGMEYVVMGKKDSSESLARIYGRTLHVLETANDRNTSPARVADELAESRLVRPKHFSDATWSGTRAGG
jgi:leucine dehydrogenase